MTRYILYLLAVMTAGCSFYSPVAPEIEADLAKEIERSSKPLNLSDKWWHEFQSDELNSLVDKALADNLTIEQAWARLKQARQTAIKAGAADDLQVNLTANSGTTHSHYDGYKSTTESYSLGLAASYEVDLWGSIDSQIEAAKLGVEISSESVNSAATTIAGQVVETWLDIITQRQKRTLLQSQLKTNTDYLELLDIRYKSSMVSSLDVLRQQQTIEQIYASLALVDSAEEVALNKLAVLLGESTASCLDIKSDIMPQMPEMPVDGVPSELLLRRPDIRSAMLNVQISDHSLAMAKAAKLPSFSITAYHSYSDSELSSLFDNWTNNLAANIAVPLIDGKRLDAEIERVKAEIEENTANYRQVVLDAVNEVINAQIQEKYLVKNIEAKNKQLDLARKALAQAEIEYFNGADTYLATLTELLKVQALELELITSRENLLLYRVSLYRALGGRWYVNDNNRESL